MRACRQLVNNSGFNDKSTIAFTRNGKIAGNRVGQQVADPFPFGAVLRDAVVIQRGIIFQADER